MNETLWWTLFGAAWGATSAMLICGISPARKDLNTALTISLALWGATLAAGFQI